MCAPKTPKMNSMLGTINHQKGALEANRVGFLFRVLNGPPSASITNAKCGSRPPPPPPPPPTHTPRRGAGGQPNPRPWARPHRVRDRTGAGGASPRAASGRCAPRPAFRSEFPWEGTRLQRRLTRRRPRQVLPAAGEPTQGLRPGASTLPRIESRRPDSRCPSAEPAPSRRPPHCPACRVRAGTARSVPAESVPATACDRPVRLRAASPHRGLGGGARERAAGGRGG